MLGEGDRPLPDNIKKFKAPKKEPEPIYTDQPLLSAEPDASAFMPISRQTGQVVFLDREYWRRDAENAIQNMMRDRGVAFVREVIDKNGNGDL